MAWDTDNMPCCLQSGKVGLIHPIDEEPYHFTSEQILESRLLLGAARRGQEQLLRQAGEWRDGY